jgi:hypothetical protein
MSIHRIRLMLSSTIADLAAERAAIATRLGQIENLEIVGVSPGSTPARAGSPYHETVNIAEDCHIYMLILGARYGYVTELQKSATQLEFEAAYRSDPTKIIVLRKTNVDLEPRQLAFVSQVEDYHKGYLTHRFESAAQAAEAARDAYYSWLADRASIGRRLDYFDHFIRIASQRSPFPGAHAEYRLTDKQAELTFTVVGRTYSVHFDKLALYNDFWGSVLHLEKRFEAWRSEGFGHSQSG